MKATFSIEVDSALGMIRLTLAGFFDAATVARLDEGRRRAIAQLGLPPNHHLTLVDISACAIQTQDMVGAFEGVIGDPQLAARRLAFVTGSSLAKMQVRRMTKGAPTAWFMDHAEAEAWLLGAEDAAAA